MAQIIDFVNMEIGLSNVTTAEPPPDNDIPVYWGYITAAIAVIFYGSNFAPVKKFETGDGMFFQWVMCSAVMIVGIIVQLIRNTQQFYPIVMIGGAIWETGNVCVVPIIKSIGMGLGLCIWGITNLVSGWATGRFGLFGINPEPPNNTTLNYIGVAVAVFSTVVFAFVKNDVTPVELEIVEETDPLINRDERSFGGTSDSLYASSSNHDVLVFNKKRNSSINGGPEERSDETVIDRLPPGPKRAVGIILSIVSGVLYGQMFTAAIYIQDNKKEENASQNGLDYVFACFCGIYLTSTVYFVIYIIFMKNQPRVYPKVILPGIFSGLMWGVATSCWFVANKVLSEPVAFPMVTTGPSIVAAVWGIFVFKEIKGMRNIGILLLGFVFVITGVALTAVSKGNK